MVGEMLETGAPVEELRARTTALVEAQAARVVISPYSRD